MEGNAVFGHVPSVWQEVGDLGRVGFKLRGLGKVDWAGRIKTPGPALNHTQETSKPFTPVQVLQICKRLLDC